jgi:L,D-transpeptidase-like protein
VRVILLGAIVLTAAACVVSPAVAPGAGGRATAARTCAPGSVRWLERWGVAYAGRARGHVTVDRRPGSGAFLSLEATDAYGFATVLPIVAERLDRACRPTWFRVRVAFYPNGTLGWIRAGTVTTSRIRRRVVVDVSRRRLVLYVRGRVSFSTPVAVGKPGTPTPFGRFYVTQRFIITSSNSPYGSRALGISAFSNVLRSWRDGGPIGIHGTNEPFSIGQPVSHGCVRLPDQMMVKLFAQVPLATPVIVRP